MSFQHNMNVRKEGRGEVEWKKSKMADFCANFQIVKRCRQTWFPDDQAIIEDPCLEQLFAPENPEPGPSDDPPLAQ